MSADKYKLSPRAVAKNAARLFLAKAVGGIPKFLSAAHYQGSLLKYDRRAGTYVDTYRRAADPDWVRDVVLDGVKTKGSFGEAFRRHIGWLAEQIFRPLDLETGSVLEVGAGELTTLVPLLKALGLRNLSTHACELSWSRCYVGSNFARSEGVKIDSIACGSVTSLAYASSSIDVVYTHYCLEELAGYEREAIAELARVARRYVILVEASFELGSKPQRNKLRNRRWNLGLQKGIRTLGLNVVRHDLVPYCTDAYHHGAITIIRKNATATPRPVEMSKIPYACPTCKGPIAIYPEAFFCESCSSAFPVLAGIPVFLPGSAITASLYPKSQALEASTATTTV